MDTTPTPSALPDNRCIGALCPKHPWMNGLRRKRNRECIQCRQEYRQEWKARPENRAAEALRRRDLREMGRVEAVMAEKLMDRIRHRACDLASARVKNVARWNEFYSEAREQITAESNQICGQEADLHGM